MNHYIGILLEYSLASLAMVFIPILSKRFKITFTLPMFILGIVLYYIDISVQWPKTVWNDEWIKVITEIIVVIIPIVSF